VADAESPTATEALDALQDLVASMQDDWYSPRQFDAAVKLLERAGRRPDSEGIWHAVGVAEEAAHG
jgi:hypothetical protein